MKRYVVTRCAKWLGIFLLAGGVIFYILQLAPPDPSQCVLAKPVIYLYPEKAQEECGIDSRYIHRHRACFAGWMASHGLSGRYPGG